MDTHLEPLDLYAEITVRIRGLGSWRTFTDTAYSCGVHGTISQASQFGYASLGALQSGRQVTVRLPCAMLLQFFSPWAEGTGFEQGKPS